MTAFETYPALHAHEGAPVMQDRRDPDAANASATLRKFTPFIVFRDGKVDRKLPVSAVRTTVGSDAGCDLCLDDPSVGARWGAIMKRGEDVYVQHEGGGPVPIESGEGFIVGPFHVVRADFGTELGRLFKTVEPGMAVQTDPGRQLYRQIVVLAAQDRGDGGAQRQHEQLWATLEGPKDTPARLSTFPLERRLSERAQDAAELISRAVGRAAADPGLRPDADPALRSLEKLSLAEISAVVQNLAGRTTEGQRELETFFRRFLLAEPVMAYRLRALVRQKYAAEARGSGEKVQFPALGIELKMHLPGEVLERYVRACAAIEALVDEGSA